MVENRSEHLDFWDFGAFVENGKINFIAPKINNEREEIDANVLFGKCLNNAIENQ